MYFKFFKPQDRRKRFVVRRRGLIQSFPRALRGRIVCEALCGRTSPAVSFGFCFSGFVRAVAFVYAASGQTALLPSSFKQRTHA